VIHLILFFSQNGNKLIVLYQLNIKYIYFYDMQNVLKIKSHYFIEILLLHIMNFEAIKIA
jgi:hypothetical protein